MLIRKLFKFENAHIVRGCSTRRCSHSIHGHSYKVEVLLTAVTLDHGQMLYDFGLLKAAITNRIDAFDHAITVWDGDEQQYREDMLRHSERWIVIPVSPSAEQFSRLFFRLIDHALQQASYNNGEQGVQLSSIIVHETDTGYAQCFREDAENPRMGPINLVDIQFSPALLEECPDLQQLTMVTTKDNPTPDSTIEEVKQ